MAIQEKAMLIFTDAKNNNNNKFYELILNEDGVLNLRWGRVGAAGQNKTTNGGKWEFDSIIHSKLAKGYVRSNTVSVIPSKAETSKIQLAETAKRDILGDMTNDKDALLVKLIDRLSEMNRHQIMVASGGNIQVDESGLITTSLGLVTKDSVLEARNLLNKIEKFVDKKSFTEDKYVNFLNDYLKLIPQKVPTRRGWYENFFVDHTNLSQQNSFLDQLEGSIDLYNTKKDDLKKQMLSNNKIASEEVFKTKLVLLEDQEMWKKIEKFYKESINRNHVSSHLKLKNIYVVQNDEWEERYKKVAKKIGNEMLLWHGTRAFNILSIFKVGLIIPRSGGSFHITGRMFGDGLYFSDQSSKSLNYSYGYWDGKEKDNNCFMFLSDVALGKSYVPDGPTKDIPKGYDSTFAKARNSGVQNNEMIVYDVNQANLRYLCEFSDK